MFFNKEQGTVGKDRMEFNHATQSGINQSSQIDLD